MTKALHTLLYRLIDYAGMFPPSSLTMEAAARNYEAYRAGPQSWMLGRFIVPSARLNEVDPNWDYVILGAPPRKVPVCELKVERAADAAPLLDMLPEGVTAYFELPIDADPAPLARGRGRAKVRTGGLTPDAFPSSADLAHFLFRCAEARVPFKATAGLHHPIRSLQRCTYEPDSPRTMMHGFINVFLAASLLWHGGKAGDAVATLDEESPDVFDFGNEAAEWHRHRLTLDQLREAREQFGISFGSCSFEEPIVDLERLGWLSI
jgi:hypothetical protein